MDFFAGPAMSQLVKTMTVETGIKRYLPSELWKKSAGKVVGDKVVYKRYIGEQSAAAIVSFNSPAIAYTPPPADKAEAVALGSCESLTIDPDTFYALNSNVPFVQENAREKVITDIANFKARMEILQTDAVASVFANAGKIYIGNDSTSGQQAILGNSSGAALTIDFGVPAGNQFTKSSTYGGVTIGNWSGNTTDIPAAIKALKYYAISQGQPEPTTVLYGQSIPAYLMNNALALQTFLSRQPELNRQFMITGEIPNGVLDMKWVPAWKQIRVRRNQQTNARTVAQWFPTNQITLIPDLTANEYEFYEAGRAVPKSIGEVTADWTQAMGLFEIVQGYFAYAKAFCWDPPGASIVNGWFGLPTLKNPLCLLSGTVS